MNNLASPSPSWSVQQQAWLRALGHTVWLYGSALTALPLPKSSAQARSTAPLQPAVLDREPPAPKSVQPIKDLTPAPSVPDPLFLALLRASGSTPHQPQIHHLITKCSLDELRANPAAKRALWPQLRALRRQQRLSRHHP